MNIFNNNPILAVDTYKYSHPQQLPDGTGIINAYIESRGSDNPVYTATVVAGLQAVIKTYLVNPITQEMVDEADSYVTPQGMPFEREGWEYIVNELDGKLPISITGIPEGTVVGMSNVLVQIVNTDERVPWLTSFVETLLLRGIWYMTSVATTSWTIKKMFIEYAEKSGSDPFVDFKLHDFGARGVSSGESAMLGGIGHLMIFQGSDTMEALVGARKMYNIDIAGFGIPASEHSTTTIWGRDKELEAYRNMLTQFGKPDAIYANVIDSYNRKKAVEMISTELQDDIIASGATCVMRPDSGCPINEPIETILQLMKYWGKDYNGKGFKTLPKSIRVIQGDGITIDSIPKILNNLYQNNLSLDNMAFGMGGGLLQQTNRDVFKFAQKASYAIVNGKGRNVSKDPIGDKSKRSKDGMLYLIKEGDTYKSVNQDEFSLGDIDLLVPFYLNGKLLRDDNLVDIRNRVDYTV